MAQAGRPRHKKAWSQRNTVVGLPSSAQPTGCGAPDLDERRFRSNIAIEGVSAWDELAWIGRRISIGDVEFDVVRSKVRCLATHANPASGVCDVQVMQTLTRAFKQQQPTFAVALATNGEGGEIRVGDTLEFLG